MIWFLDSYVLFIPLHAYFWMWTSVSLSVLFCISKCHLTPSIANYDLSVCVPEGSSVVVPVRGMIDFCWCGKISLVNVPNIASEEL